MRQGMMMFLCGLSLMGCVSKETTTATVEALREAGKDIAAEVRTQAGGLATDLIATARVEFANSKGDIMAAARAALSEIPGLAASAGQRAAIEALAKRVDEAEGLEKGAKFREIADTEGPRAGLEWLAGGGGLLGIGLYLLRLMRKKSVLTTALKAVTTAIEESPDSRSLKQTVLTHGGDQPAVREMIAKIKKL